MALLYIVVFCCKLARPSLAVYIRSDYRRFLPTELFLFDPEKALTPTDPIIYYTFFGPAVSCLDVFGSWQCGGGLCSSHGSGELTLDSCSSTKGMPALSVNLEGAIGDAVMEWKRGPSVSFERGMLASMRK